MHSYNNHKKTKMGSESFQIVIAIVFFIIVGISVFFHKIPLIVLVVYLSLSIITYIMYAIDKSAAQKGTWRTKESTLHLLSLVGGWAGALIAQAILRHKSQKQSFRFIFWITVVINLAIFIWLFALGNYSILGLNT